MDSAAFTYIDWIVVFAMFAAILAISWSSSKHIKTQDDYMLGGGRLKSGMVGLSLFATLSSSLTYLSNTGEMIKNGPMFLAALFSFAASAWIVGKFIIPRIMKFKVKSAYECLEMNVGKGSRTLATVFFISLRFMWMCTIVFASVNAAVIPILGLPESWAPAICAGMILFTMFFTTIGGLKAVVYTDALQSVIMFLGALVTIVVILFKLGSVQDLSNPELYSHWVKFDLAPRLNVRMTVANIFIMNLCWQICTACSDQMAIQRYLSVGNTMAAKRSYNVFMTSIGIILVLLGAVGLLVMAYFSENPSLLEPGTTIASAADTLFPRFIRIGLPAGATGLIASAIIAAAISSLSSGLNSTATVIQEDILKKMRRFKGREFSLRSIKTISVLIGVAVLGGSFLVKYVQGNLFDLTMKLVNLFAAPLGVLFILAMFSPVVTDRGVITGGICSLAAAVAISFFGVFGIVQTWNVFFALVVGVATGIAFSWIDSKLFTSSRTSSRSTSRTPRS